jgi:hypothetical protein
MGGLKGQRIFTAAYTVLNEFEEVCSHSLASSMFRICSRVSRMA